MWETDDISGVAYYSHKLALTRIETEENSCTTIQDDKYITISTLRNKLTDPQLAISLNRALKTSLNFNIKERRLLVKSKCEVFGSQKRTFLRCWRSAWYYLSSTVREIWWSGCVLVLKWEIYTGWKGIVNKKGHPSVFQRHAIPSGQCLIRVNFILKQTMTQNITPNDAKPI